MHLRHVSGRLVNKHFVAHVLIVLHIMHSTFTSALSSKELCSSRICSGCIAHSLSCQEGGLQQIPDSLSFDITSMILMGHQFANPSLTKDNFSMYVYQEVKLQRLTLRNCAIKYIESATFDSLKHLEQLDLSQNKIQFVKSHTFQGLTLNFLRLDENVGLHFHAHAFRDAKIASLSINQCGLTSLNYEIIEPLVMNKHLTNLHLTGNQLITLESQYEVLFGQMDSLSIEQNPFHCDCKMHWLSNVLHRRQLMIKHHQTRELYLDNVLTQPDSFNAFMESKSNTAVLDEDLLKPVCRTPRRLSGRTVESLDVSDFYCDMPKLEMLEIDLGAINLGQVANQPNDNLQTILRCHMKGSPELQVDWYTPSANNQVNQEFNYSLANLNPHLLKRLPSTKLSGTKSVELKLVKRWNDNDSNNNWNMNYTNEVNNFNYNVNHLICFGSDSNGNLSAQISIRWPKLLQKSDTVDMKQGHAIQSVSNENNDKQLKKVDEEKRQLILASDGQTVGWYTVAHEDKTDSFFFQKQFSVLEMIGAVVGTFTVTLMLFMFICCLLRFHQKNQEKLRIKYQIGSQNTYNSSSAILDNHKSPFYSATSKQINSSQFTSTMDGANLNLTARNYVNTNNSNPTSNPDIMTPITPTTNSVQLKTNGTIFSDLPNHPRFPYTQYEPVSSDDLQTSNTYSDSQTYDLPHINPIHSSLNVPLPPIPSAFMTNSTIPLGLNQTFGLGEHESRVPFLLAPTNDVIQNGPIMNSMFANESQNFANVLSATSTLNRLHSNQFSLIQPTANHYPQYQTNTVQNLAVVQNQFLDFLNHQQMLQHHHHHQHQQQQQQQQPQNGEK